MYKNLLKNQHRDIYIRESENLRKTLYAVGGGNWTNIKHREELTLLTAAVSSFSQCN